MANRRVFEIARDLGMSSKVLRETIDGWGLGWDVSNHMKSLTPDQQVELAKRLGGDANSTAAKPKPKSATKPKAKKAAKPKATKTKKADKSKPAKPKKAEGSKASKPKKAAAPKAETSKKSETPKAAKPKKSEPPKSETPKPEAPKAAPEEEVGPLLSLKDKAEAKMKAG